MKKLHTLISILFIFTINAHAQWKFLRKSTREVYTEVRFFDTNTGYIVGKDSNSKSLVLHTKDGGKNWNQINSTMFPKELISVSKTYNDITYAGGSQLIKSLDSGLTWDSVAGMTFAGKNRANIVIKSITFYNAKKGLATLNNDSGIYITNDGGVNWTLAFNAGANSSPAWVRYVDSSYITGLSNNGVFYSADGGKNWSIAAKNSAFKNKNMYCICFMNNQVGYAGGEGLFKTLDGGKSWKQISVDTAQAIRGIQFIDSVNGFISTNNEGVWLTNDKGATWKKLNVNNAGAPNFDLLKTAFLDNKKAVSVTSDGTTNAILYIENLDSATTGIDDLILNKTKIKLYPNPVKDVLNIEIENAVASDKPTTLHITLFNTLGQKVYDSQLSKSSKTFGKLTTIDLKNIPAGVYMVQIISGDKRAVRQVVKL
ncbi:MAG: YCF48-related protein [Bacteroidetes bacterium]|nr:YCF48-related protein [Bacteroidota bacterium]